VTTEGKHAMKKEIERKVYWPGELSPNDDFGVPYKNIMFDAKTKNGPWANMTEKSFRNHAVGLLGTGFGQMYEKQPDGRWLKIKG
jgi:hypothetical protein